VLVITNQGVRDTQNIARKITKKVENRCLGQGREHPAMACDKNLCGRAHVIEKLQCNMNGGRALIKTPRLLYEDI